ncbi:O-acetyltransferase [Roseomonas mucosa]|uniref:acyltransferase n=1 Tax=Roseomonas mucosa TaxID=207340 RepID=UPI002204BB90|nr:acyltransferase [Roseomonas mucosa]QDJ08891.1 O-acetyltransferase [Roseomonas mucosa]
MGFAGGRMHNLENYPVLGGPGFSLPNLNAMKRVEIRSGEDAIGLAALGINLRIHDPVAAGDHCRTRIYFEQSIKPRKLLIELSPRTLEADIVLGGAYGLNGSLKLNGSRCCYIDMGSAHKASYGLIHLMSDNGVFYFGREATANHFVTTCKGQGNALLIGEDCMLATEILINPTDFHAVVDLETNEILNEAKGPTRPIIIHPHVWLGGRAIIMKGVTIGAGSVVAAASVVTRSLPDRVVAGGNPARVLRTNASWTRNLLPSVAEIEQIKERLDTSWIAPDQTGV